MMLIGYLKSYIESKKNDFIIKFQRKPLQSEKAAGFLGLSIYS